MCPSYFRSEYTLMTNLSLQLGGMDILLDWTIVLQHFRSIVFISFGLRGLVVAFTGIHGFWVSLMLRCSFITVLASTDTIVYCCLYCIVPARQYA
jgi:hypothetical protein